MHHENKFFIQQKKKEKKSFHSFANSDKLQDDFWNTFLEKISKTKFFRFSIIFFPKNSTKNLNTNYWCENKARWKVNSSRSFLFSVSQLGYQFRLFISKQGQKSTTVIGAKIQQWTPCSLSLEKYRDFFTKSYIRELNFLNITIKSFWALHEFVFWCDSQPVTDIFWGANNFFYFFYFFMLSLIVDSDEFKFELVWHKYIFSYFLHKIQWIFLKM